MQINKRIELMLKSKVDAQNQSLFLLPFIFPHRSIMYKLQAENNNWCVSNKSENTKEKIQQKESTKRINKRIDAAI